MDDTQIKTRLGLILQGLIREALNSVNITFQENHQYDERYETPDFLIPNANAPEFVVEVHQTDARNSFQMKTLRAFTAISEAKVFYGNELISINILSGDPNNELPVSNLSALFGFFDINIIPRNQSVNQSLVVALEGESLRLASDESFTVADAVNSIIVSHQNGIVEIANLLHETLQENNPSAKTELFPIWELERTRINSLEEYPLVSVNTYYKRTILWSLYVSDEHFTELIEVINANDYSEELKEQLILTKLAEDGRSLRGRVITLDPIFQDFLINPEAARLRSLCETKMFEEPAMRWFFEDIRNHNRRQQMVENFIQLFNNGSREFFLESVIHCFNNRIFLGIQHTRCWLADLMPLAVGESHNSFNKRMLNHPQYNQTLGNPFNNITICSPRLGSNENILINYLQVAVSCFYEACTEKNILPSSFNLLDLNKKLVILRMSGAIKLQKLNPLYLVIESLATSLNIYCSYQGTNSLLSDLAGRSDAVGKYDMYYITNGTRTILVNAVAVHDHHGDDKSKEWGARRRAALYRFLDNQVEQSRFRDGLFVIDGEWEQRDINRLYMSGWNYIIRLPELENTLRQIFNI